jgi:hypothetical protein
LRNLSVGDEETAQNMAISNTEKDWSYYPKWDELQLLLRNVSKEDIAKEYFDFYVLLETRYSLVEFVFLTVNCVHNALFGLP